MATLKFVPTLCLAVWQLIFKSSILKEIVDSTFATNPYMSPLLKIVSDTFNKRENGTQRVGVGQLQATFDPGLP